MLLSTMTTSNNIKKALKAVNGNITLAARELELSRTTLHDHIHRTPELLVCLKELRLKEEEKKLKKKEALIEAELEINSNVAVHREVISPENANFTSEKQIREKFDLEDAEYPLESININKTDNGPIIKTSRFKKNKDYDKLKPFAELIYAPKNYKVNPKLSRIKQERQGFRLALIESDLHCHPVHFDFEFNEVINQFGKWLAPDESIGLGDDVHNDDFGKYPVEDVKLYSPLWKDVEIAREVTLGRVNVLPEGTKFTRLVGNHDEPRNNKKLINSVGAENSKLLLKSWDKVMGYEEMGINMILGDGGANYPYGYYEPEGQKIRFIHGGPLSLESYLDKYGITTVCGHWHTKQIITTHNQQQEIVNGYKMPSVAKSNQGYRQDPKGHCQGVGVATFYDDGTHRIEYADWDPNRKLISFRDKQFKYNGS